MNRGILLSALLTLTAAAAHAAGAEIVPAQRRIAWEPGIPGAIPDIPADVNVMDHGAAADGATDDHAAFESAISALPPEGGVVLVPEGEYVLGSTIDLDDRVVIRGEGSDKTRLLFGMTDNAPCFEAVTYERGDWVDVLSGCEKGSREIVVADAGTFDAGDFVEIQQDNDPAIMYTRSDWNVAWAQNSMGQILIVEDVSGATLSLNGPLYLTYRSELRPRIRTQGFVEYAGVERLFVRKTVQSADGATFVFKNAAYCWVREVESDHTRTSHVATNTAYRCEFRGNYFHHAWDHGGGGHGYGVNLGLHTTDCLVENNIFRHLRHSMLVQVGACGNVFGYNYSIENVQGEGETDLNRGWTPCDISLHGHYPNYNLFESNVVQEIDVADYWGPCGPGNTFLRNLTQSEGIDIMDQSHGQNVVGNVLGTDKNDLTIESGVNNTLAHGNFENGSVQWDAAIDDRTLPVSYYLSEKPPFVGDTPWPSVRPHEPYGDNLPARQRYERGEYTPAAVPIAVREHAAPAYEIVRRNGRLVIAVDPGSNTGVSMAVYTAAGEKIRQLTTTPVNDGRHEIPLRCGGTGAPSGVYFVSISTARQGQPIRLLLD